MRGPRFKSLSISIALEWVIVYQGSCLFGVVLACPGVTAAYRDSYIGRLLALNELVDGIQGLLFALTFEPLGSQFLQSLLELFIGDDP